MVAKSGFTFDDLSRMGPDALTRKRMLAEALLRENSGIQDIRHPLQGFAQLANALVGRMKESQVDKAETRAKEGAGAQWNELAASMGMGGEFPQAPGGQQQPSAPVGEGGAAIRQGLIDRGMPEHIADAFVMNFQDESGLNPGINEQNPIVPGSRGGFGLSQWTGPRRKALEAYAAQRGANVGDAETQLDFLMTELQGPEKAAWQAIQSAPDTGRAAAAIVNKFLRPAESHRASRERRYLGGQRPVQVAGGGQEAIAQALMQGENNPGNIGMPDGTAAQGDFPPAPSAPQQWTPAQPIQQGGPDINMLMQAAGNEWMNPSQRGIIEALMGQQLKRQDPEYSLDREIKRAQLDQLRTKDEDWQKLDDDTLYNKRGELKELGKPGGGFKFGGSSVEAQALNGMMESGRLTPEQAQDIAAGKVITNPADGSMIFMSPQGLVGVPAGGGTAEILGAGASSPTTNAPSAEPSAGGAGLANTVPGARTLTPGKPGKLATEGERRNRALYSVVEPELKTVEDHFNSLTELKNQAWSKMPFSEYMTTPEYQKASNALQTIVRSYLYSVSGATATPDEVKGQTDILTPKPGEDEGSRANKLARIKTMVDAIRQSGGQWEPTPGDAPPTEAAPKASSKSIKDMSDEELEAIINGQP